MNDIESLINTLLTSQEIYDRDGHVIGFRPPTCNEILAAKVLRQMIEEKNEIQKQEEH